MPIVGPAANLGRKIRCGEDGMALQDSHSHRPRRDYQYHHHDYQQHDCDYQHHDRDYRYHDRDYRYHDRDYQHHQQWKVSRGL